MEKRESYFTLKKNKTLRYLFFLLFGLVIVAVAYLFRSFFWTLVMAVIFYMALLPLYDMVLKIFKRRSVSSAVVILVLVLLVLVPFFFLFLSLADQTYQLYLFVQNKINTGLFDDIQNNEFVKWTVQYFGLNEKEMIQRSTETLQKLSLKIFSSITAIVSYPLVFVLRFFFMLLMLYYFLKDGHHLGKVFYRTMPFPYDIEKDVVDKLTGAIKVLLAGNLFIMLLQGLMVGLPLAFLEFKAPLLWGSIAAVLSLIPVVGTTLVWVPAAIYLLVQGFYAQALFLVLWCLFWYFFLENFLKPIILGDRLNFHPVLFFFLLLGSIQTLGLPGVIIGPVLLTLFYSLWEIYNLISDYEEPSKTDTPQ